MCAGHTLRTDGAGYQDKVIGVCNDPGFRGEETRRFGTIGLICGATRSEQLMTEVARPADEAWQPVAEPAGTGSGAAGPNLPKPDIRPHEKSARRSGAIAPACVLASFRYASLPLAPPGRGCGTAQKLKARNSLKLRAFLVAGAGFGHKPKLVPMVAYF